LKLNNIPDLQLHFYELGFPNKDITLVLLLRRITNNKAVSLGYIEPGH